MSAAQNDRSVAEIDQAIIAHMTWDDSEIAALRRHAAAGDAIGYIAALLGRTVQGCNSIARKNGIDLTASYGKDRIIKVQKAAEEAKWEMGAKARAIAATYAGRRYEDDPRAVAPDQRRAPSRPAKLSSCGSAAAMCIGN